MSEHGTLRRLGAEILAVLPAWVVARILVATGLLVATITSDRLTPGAEPTPLADGLLAWDGTWYRDIAAIGYGGLPEEGLRFFPLLALLGRILAPVAGGEGVAIVVVANAASLVFAVLVRRLVLAEGHSRAAADRAVWYTALFPAAFVLSWAYAEAVMLAAATWAMLALRSRRWWWAALAGAVAGATRPLGLLLVFPAAVEVIRCWSGSDRRAKLGGLAAVAGPIVGTGTYLAWVWQRFGDPFLPFTVQDPLRGGGADPISRLWEGVGHLLGPERLGDGLHVPFAFGFLVLLVLTFRWWPASYGVFAAAVLVVSLSAENLNSLERYGLNAFPLLLTLALLARREEVDRAVLVVSGGGLVALSTLAWLGAYVP